MPRVWIFLSLESKKLEIFDQFEIKNYDWLGLKYKAMKFFIGFESGLKVGNFLLNWIKSKGRKFLIDLKSKTRKFFVGLKAKGRKLFIGLKIIVEWLWSSNAIFPVFWNLTKRIFFNLNSILLFFSWKDFWPKD